MQVHYLGTFENAVIFRKFFKQIVEENTAAYGKATVFTKKTRSTRKTIVKGNKWGFSLIG